MLLPWSKPATLLIAPEGLALRRANDTRVQMLTSETTPAKWDALLAALETLLPALHLTELQVVLSNHYVRYLVLPWQNQLLSAQDWQGLAVHQFHALHGNASESWDIQIALQGFGNNVLACAVDQSLITRLTALTQRHNIKLHSIVPMLVAAYNRYLSRLQHADGLLVVEPHHLLLAEFQQGNWKCCSIASPPPDQLENECVSLLARARLELPTTRRYRAFWVGSPDISHHETLRSFDIHALNHAGNHPLTALIPQR